MPSLLEPTEEKRERFISEQRQLLQTLADEGQHPTALFVGCSDARVLPEHLFANATGDLFMLRNIANVVPPYIQTEIGTASVLEYAVLALQVPHVIICGHTDCGGIQALDGDVDMTRTPALARWLDLARPAQQDVDFRMKSLSAKERHVAIVEQNVLHQLQNVRSYPFVREAIAADRLELHGWVYDIFRQEVSYYDAAAEQFHLFTHSE